MREIKGCVVREKYEFFESNDFLLREYGELDAQGIRNVLVAATRISLTTLIIDLDVAPAESLLQSLYSYRVLRPNTRIIILAQNRCPPDQDVARVVAMGIYDIVAATEEKLIPELEQALNSSPATYNQAAKWAMETEGEKVSASNRTLNNFLFRFSSRFKINSPSFNLVISDDEIKSFNYLEKAKGKYLVIDANQNRLALLLGVNRNTLWKHDWRLGGTSTPYSSNRNIELYCLPEEDINEMDLQNLVQKVNQAINKGKKILIYTDKEAVAKAMEGEKINVYYL